MSTEDRGKDLRELWAERARRVADAHARTSVVGMTRRPRAPEERQFLRSLGPEQEYGGLWFIEVEHPPDPIVLEVCRVLVSRFAEDPGAYLHWLHTPQARLGEECPHELLARGEADSVLRLLRHTEKRDG